MVSAGRGKGERAVWDSHPSWWLSHKRTASAVGAAATMAMNRAERILVAGRGWAAGKGKGGGPKTGKHISGQKTAPSVTGATSCALHVPPPAAAAHFCGAARCEAATELWSLQALAAAASASSGSVHSLAARS